MPRIEMNILSSTDTALLRKSTEDAGMRRLAIVYHLKISDTPAYESWLRESQGKFGCKRLFRVKADPVAREGMLLDEIIIDEFSSPRSALMFLSVYSEALQKACSEHAILVVKPEPWIKFRLVKFISWLIRLFKAVSDKGIPTATWKAENTSIWPDEDQMKVAREQALDEPLYVYNLNKYKPEAEYKDFTDGDTKISGKAAYERYAKIAGFELLRRGAYPVYGGEPICLFANSETCMLTDDWDHFIFVQYPQRRNLLAMIESAQFQNGEAHRDAGLERVAVFMTKMSDTTN
ncbi:hypothetical protein [Shewanella sedimentimangrovi]|uniref:DUF1330 domain-containing protein n=1 Tax=Shewanella sedimentimangrovi TaxID=2814293 RepID=A0ABX7R1I5_9GAMM|nr:hypothetical protein [Shewanella sedimentimangrovi]QSX37666.1 hypothetical protein JYB85_02165 [Shewanella sedimentimangrovi]